MPRVDCIIGVQLSAVQVDLYLAFLGSPKGNVFLLENRQSAALWLRNFQSGCLVDGECENGSLRTHVRRRFWARARQAPSADLNRDIMNLKSGRGSNLGLGLNFCPFWPLYEGDSISSPWRFTHNGSCEMLQTTRIPSDQQLRPFVSLQYIPYRMTPEQGS